MTLAETLEIGLRFRHALLLGLAVSIVSSFLVLPTVIAKLRRAGIVGKDRHKEGAPEIPEMGGIGVFIAFNVGAFTILGFGILPDADEALILAALVVCAGACMTGILDDLVDLPQRLKAFIPIAFAAPLALYAPDAHLAIPFVGSVNFGIAYSILLVPLAVAFASNAFNMLEGFNGLGSGMGIVMAGAIAALAILNGNITGLALVLPLLGALLGFMKFNFVPAKVFPGDTMTLFVGCVLACAAILSKVEFWAGILFLPHLVEFLLKAQGRFKVQSFAKEVKAGRMLYEGPTRSLTHIVMKTFKPTEGGLVAVLWMGEILLAAAVVGLFVLL